MKSAIIFGYNEFALEIAESLKTKYSDITLLVLQDEDGNFLQDKGFKVAKFDLLDDWSSLEKEYDLENLIIFCALEETSENIFLTISLRATFEKLLIIALSNDHESGRKLKMAGANKIIPIAQTTVNIITELLERPFVTEILNNILFAENNLKIAQWSIPKNAELIGRYIEDVDWKYKYGLIILAVIRENLDTSFIYTKKANHEPLKEGNILVLVGFKNDIESLELMYEGDMS
jgi:Trk K+ transport system NAD-binding subunit